MIHTHEILIFFFLSFFLQWTLHGLKRLMGESLQAINYVQQWIEPLFQLHQGHPEALT